MTYPEQLTAGTIRQFLHTAIAGTGAAALLSLALAAHAQNSTESPAKLDTTPTAWRVTAETLKLPGAEKMGMVGGDLLFDVSDKLRLGVGTYGAVRGERGGFITLG